MMFTRKFPEPTELPERPTAERFERLDATAQKQRNGWKIESVERPEIVAVHASLPVAVSEMKRLLAVDEITIKF